MPWSIHYLRDTCAQRGNIRTIQDLTEKGFGLQKGNKWKCSRGPASKKERTHLHFIVLRLAQAFRSSSFIHRSHSTAPLAFIVALACTSPALILPHRRSRSQAPCAHPRSHARECLAFIVAHRRSSSSLIHAQARERLALIVALACNSPALVPHRRTSALMLSCVLRSSMLMLDARDALRSSSLMLAIALRSSSLMLATALRSSSLIVAHARNRPCNRLGPKT